MIYPTQLCHLIKEREFIGCKEVYLVWNCQIRRWQEDFGKVLLYLLDSSGIRTGMGL